MNRSVDIDQLLRGWLDEGETTPPERYVWAALERIETTRQRGALVVSLEEFIMRAQPLAAAAAVAIVALLGLAVYVALAGGPNVGDPDATPSPAPGAFQTEAFGSPFSVLAPDEWTVIEEQNAIAFVEPAGEQISGQRISVIDTDRVRVLSGPGGASLPWPEDLASLLADFPLEEAAQEPLSMDLTLEGTEDTTIAGERALVADVSTSVDMPPDAGTSAAIIVAEPVNAHLGTDVILFAGTGRARFVEFRDRNVAVIYSAGTELFSEDRFSAFLGSFRFTDD